MTALDLDTSMLEELDFEPTLPCEIERANVIPPQGECDDPALWIEITSCDTDGCPDQTIHFCDRHAAMLRYAQVIASSGDSCAWCGTLGLSITWRRLV